MIQDRLQIVLASQSPRRAKLLSEAGYQFTVFCPPDSVEEAAIRDLPPEQLVLNLANAKGRFASEQLNAEQKKFRNESDRSKTNHTTTIVIAADTIAECENSILGKPQNRQEAESMLRLMGGKRHRVLTGVSLWNLNQLQHIERLEVTTLLMDRLDEQLLEIYLESEDWKGKAGAFGYQDGLDWVHIVEGLASNVVGLPVERLPSWIDELISL